MKLGSRFKKAGLMLSGGYVIEHGIMLVRTIIVARMLGPENFGIASTFFLVIGGFALISDMGIEKYLQHVRASELPQVQPSLGAILIIRGLISCLLIYGFSSELAALFQHTELANLYMVLALLPLIDGFKHLDPLRQQRDLVYLPSIKVQLGSLIPGATVTVILAILTQSYVAVIWGSLVSACLSVTLSHVLAAERYRLGFDRAVIGRVMIYGWPLLLNGLVIFLSNQGDRIVVGAMNGMVELAGYVAIGSLTVGMSLFLAKLTGNLFLPILSAVKDDPVAFARRNQFCGAISIALLAVTLIPMIILGKPLVTLLFGAEYQIPSILAGWLSILAGARVLRCWPVVVALSIGFTRDILYANLIRVGGLCAAFWAVSSGYGVVGVAASMATGELSATLFALWRADRKNPAKGHTGLVLGGVFCALCGLAMVTHLTPLQQGGWPMLIVAAIAVASVGIGTIMAFSDELRRRSVAATRSIIAKIV